MPPLRRPSWVIQQSAALWRLPRGTLTSLTSVLATRTADPNAVDPLVCLVASLLWGLLPQNVCRFCSDERELFELDRDGRPVKDRFCNKCLAEAAKQRGSVIPRQTPARLTPGASALLQSPPAYFQYAFYLSGPYSGASGPLLPWGHAIRPLVDTSYVDGLLRQESLVEKDASGLDDEDWESYSRRRQSHFASLSTATSETKEKLLAELFND